MPNPPVPQTLAHCMQCGPSRQADVIFRYDQEDLAVLPHTGTKTFRILQCRGCLDVFFKTTSVVIKGTQIDAEGEVIFLDGQSTTRKRTAYWPPRKKRSVPNWEVGLWLIDEELHGVFTETYGAFNSGLSVLAAIGMRASIDRATQALGIDQSRGFGHKLLQLVEHSYITKSDHEHIKTLVGGGHAATHRAWKPTDEQLESMFLILEAFLHRVFILPERASDLAKQVPFQRSKE